MVNSGSGITQVEQVGGLVLGAIIIGAIVMGFTWASQGGSGGGKFIRYVVVIFAGLALFRYLSLN